MKFLCLRQITDKTENFDGEILRFQVQRNNSVINFRRCEIFFPVLSLIKKVFLRQIEQKFSSRKKKRTEQTRSSSQVSAASGITFFHENQFADRKKYFFYEKTFFTLCRARNERGETLRTLELQL